MKSHSNLHSSHCSARRCRYFCSLLGQRERKGREAKRTNKPEAAPVLLCCFFAAQIGEQVPDCAACGRQIMIIVCECVLCTPPTSLPPLVPPTPSPSLFLTRLPFHRPPLSPPRATRLVFSFLAAAKVGRKRRKMFRLDKAELVSWRQSGRRGGRRGRRRASPYVCANAVSH